MVTVIQEKGQAAEKAELSRLAELQLARGEISRAAYESKIYALKVHEAYILGCLPPEDPDS